MKFSDLQEPIYAIRVFDTENQEYKTFILKEDELYPLYGFFRK